MAAESPTPLLDQQTVARFVLDDFLLTDEERVVLADPQARYVFEESCLREVIDFPGAAARALEMWRERR